MTRFFLSAGFFLITFLFETSFFSSLPSFLALTPLVFGLSIYLIQHEGMMDGFVWMVLYGILMDLFHIAPIPFSFFAWVIAAGLSVLMARHVFSNRSFYGVLGCAFGGYLCLMLSETIILFLQSLTDKLVVDWSIFFHTALQQSLMLLCVMSFIFAIARRIRSSPFFL
ncbi:MAG: hypothetical protein AAB431_00700 [Patescibacteria group bacterium]